MVCQTHLTSVSKRVGLGPLLSETLESFAQRQNQQGEPAPYGVFLLSQNYSYVNGSFVTLHVCVQCINVMNYFSGL